MSNPPSKKADDHCGIFMIVIAIIAGIAGIIIGGSFVEESFRPGDINLLDSQCNSSNIEILIEKPDGTRHWKSLGVECK